MRYKYLLDSNIISEISKPLPSQFVVDRMRQYEKACVISAITLQELLLGLELLPAGKRKAQIQSYLDVVLKKFDVLYYDSLAASAYAKIMAKCKIIGSVRPICDTQIAATALANDLVLVTRNVKDFMPIVDFLPLKIENWFE